MRKVFLDELPHGGKYITKNQINWQKSVGCTVKFIYDDIKGEIKIAYYKQSNKETYLYINYLNQNPFCISTYNFKTCRLGKLLNKYTNEFKVEIGQIFKDDKRDLIITDRKYRKDKENCNRKWYKYKCNKCGWDEGWMREEQLLKGTGCSCCCNPPKTVVPGINDIPTTAPWMVKYFQGGIDEARLYSKKSEKKVYTICPDCGRIKNKHISVSNIYKNHSIGCTCSDKKSYPEKLSYELLNQLNTIYQFNYIEHEYSPHWIGQKRYDNYFEYNNNKYILEMDGNLGHGYRDNPMNGQTKEESQNIDDYKDKLANEHNIKVIRIDCIKSDLEYIKNNILHSKLTEIFDLSNINWLQCEEFALSNLVKKACEYKKNNPNITTTKIGNIMKLSKPTIREYLKKGTKLEWCHYDVKEEVWKSLIKGRENSRKAVQIFKDNILLGAFASCLELERQSEKIFSVKLDNRHISDVCNGKRKTHKGFTFKYI
jgi:hypothetical protein